MNFQTDEKLIWLIDFIHLPDWYIYIYYRLYTCVCMYRDILLCVCCCCAVLYILCIYRRTRFTWVFFLNSIAMCRFQSDWHKCPAVYIICTWIYIEHIAPFRVKPCDERRVDTLYIYLFIIVVGYTYIHICNSNRFIIDKM